MAGLLPFLYAACLLLVVILLLNMFSQAFKQSILWGVLCVLFPAGTIIYCKKNWTIAKSLAIPILILSVSSILFKLFIMTTQ